MKLRRLLRILIWPRPAAAAAISLFAFPLVAYVLSRGLSGTPLAYFSYLMSAYALTILTALTARAVKNALLRIPAAAALINDNERRALLSLRLSTAVSLAYAAFKGVSGILWFSPFRIFGAFYFAVTALMRIIILRHKGRDDEAGAARTASVLMFLLDTALAGMTIHSILWLEGASYPGTLIYAAAAYSFYAVIAAARSLVLYRHDASPAIRTAKAISLSVAALSLYALQTAMFAAFGGSIEFQRMMNTLTGGAVVLLNTVLAIMLILKNREEK